jgi:hypothetical protein
MRVIHTISGGGGGLMGRYNEGIIRGTIDLIIEYIIMRNKNIGREPNIANIKDYKKIIYDNDEIRDTIETEKNKIYQYLKIILRDNSTPPASVYYDELNFRLSHKKDIWYETNPLIISILNERRTGDQFVPDLDSTFVRIVEPERITSSQQIDETPFRAIEVNDNDEDNIVREAEYVPDNDNIRYMTRRDNYQEYLDEQGRRIRQETEAERARILQLIRQHQEEQETDRALEEILEENRRYRDEKEGVGIRGRKIRIHRYF